MPSSSGTMDGSSYHLTRVTVTLLTHREFDTRASVDGLVEKSRSKFSVSSTVLFTLLRRRSRSSKHAVVVGELSIAFVYFVGSDYRRLSCLNHQSFSTRELDSPITAVFIQQMLL